MIAAGIAAGFLWAMIPALLRTRFNTNEILVSLMLVYVAMQFLNAMVFGALKNPEGFAFPGSRNFHDSAILPRPFGWNRVHLGVWITLALVPLAHLFLSHHLQGYRVRLYGEAPKAAGFAGVRPDRVVVFCLGLSGALAGLAGTFEAAGPAEQLTQGFPTGYGFTAIIVAYLGRLSPFGILLAAAIMALTYIGGETAQFTLGIPAAANETFRGMLLFFLLALDLFVRYRFRPARREVVS
jgi:simple sugar transport system permease protein